MQKFFPLLTYRFVSYNRNKPIPSSHESYDENNLINNNFYKTNTFIRAITMRSKIIENRGQKLLGLIDKLILSRNKHNTSWRMQTLNFFNLIKYF